MLDPDDPLEKIHKLIIFAKRSPSSPESPDALPPHPLITYNLLLFKYMYIYNTTFMVEQSEKENFLTWMRSHALPALVNDSLPAMAPRLTLVAEVPGDPEFAAQAASFAFQVEFNSIEDAKKWAETALMPVGGQFTSKFGPEHGLMFATILEVVDL